MKIAPKQKELLIKMRDEKLSFVKQKFGSHWKMESEKIKFETNQYFKIIILALFKKGVLSRKIVGYDYFMYATEPRFEYYLNHDFKIFINSL